MSILKAVLGFVFALLLALISLPWVIIAIGYDFWGNDEKVDWWMEHSPVILWIDWKNQIR